MPYVKENIPPEVHTLIQNEVKKNRYIPPQDIKDIRDIMPHPGKNDRLVRFNKTAEIVTESPEETSPIIEHRFSIIKEVYNLYRNHVKEDIDILMPFCFSDTTDNQLQEYPSLVFSREDYSNNILLPPFTAFTHHLSIDPCITPVYNKVQKMCFAGSYTGGISKPDIPYNTRLAVALLAQDDQHFDFNMNKPPGMSQAEFDSHVKSAIELFPTLSPEKIFKVPYVSQESQLLYTFQLCIDGHSSAWARLPWQLSSNCVTIKVRGIRYRWVEWYYPLLKNHVHMIETPVHDIRNTYDFLCKDKELQQFICNNARDFASKYLNTIVNISVFFQTLIELTERKSA